MTVVLLERPSPQVAVVRFNRPEVRNALNTEVRHLLDGYFAELAAGDAIRAVVLTGSEKVFAAGADIFYHDVDPQVTDAAIAMLSCDAPLGLITDSTELTAQGWGSVPRTYLRCLHDHGVPLPLQDRFIAEADAAFPRQPDPGSRLESAHSPFLSMPDRVAGLVAAVDVAGPVAAGNPST